MSGSCTYICPCMAPCFLFPRYFDVRADLMTQVSAYRSGRLLFSDRFSEEGRFPANVLDAGAELTMLSKVEAVSMSRTSAEWIVAVRSHKSRVRCWESGITGAEF